MYVASSGAVTPLGITSPINLYVTLYFLSSTVTVTVSVIVGSSFDVIVIVVVPSPTAIILPSLSTFATPGSSVSYVSSLTVASSLTFASISVSSLTNRLISFLFSGTIISVTGVFTVTVTVSLASGLSTEVIVIVAVPSFFAVTTPFSSIVTLSSLSDSYVTFLFVAFSGFTVTLSSFVLPGLSSNSFSSTVISVTGTLTFTVTVSLFDGSSFEYTVIVVSPSPTGVILPYSSIFATVSSSDS